VRRPTVVEREPLEVVVIEAPPADATTQAGVDVPVPTDTAYPSEPVRAPSWLWLLIVAAGALLFLMYRLEFAPLLLRFEHGFQRRYLDGETYDAPTSEPHTRRQK
jgi:hypothetical protein